MLLLADSVRFIIPLTTLLPEDISAAVASYLNTPEKVVLFGNGICGVLSTILLDIQEPISQILTVATPNNDYIKPVCCYLQTYNKGKNALSFDDNITAIRKLIRSAKDETAVLTDCIHADNTIRREEVIRELLVLNTNAECKPHNLAVISTCGQYVQQPALSDKRCSDRDPARIAVVHLELH